MSKRAYKYHLRLEQRASIKHEAPQPEPLDLDFENHDDIFDIVKRMQQRNPFQEPNQAVEFAIGLKLFSEVLIKNRENPLFAEFAPAFKTFMQRLKASGSPKE